MEPPTYNQAKSGFRLSQGIAGEGERGLGGRHDRAVATDQYINTQSG
jgi:hypothetical protein